jgi:hypothetical protein
MTLSALLGQCLTIVAEAHFEQLPDTPNLHNMTIPFFVRRTPSSIEILHLRLKRRRAEFFSSPVLNASALTT